MIGLAMLSALVVGTTPAAAKMLLYVPIAWQNNITVIDTDTDSVVATVPFDRCAGPKNNSCGPSSIAMQPDGGRGYVTLGYPADSPGGALDVFEPRTGTFTTRIAVDESPQDIVLSPDGRRGYVTQLTTNAVSVIDLDGRRVIATISTGSEPVEAAISADGSRLYVANFGEPLVTVIDTETNSVAGRIEVGQYGRYAASVAVLPDGRQIYVAMGGSGAIAVADAATMQAVSSFSPSHPLLLPSHIALSPTAHRAYVVTDQPQHLRQIDWTTNTIEDTGLALPYTSDMVVSPDGSRAYAVGAGYGNNIYSVDLRAYRVTATIAVGNYPGRFALAPAPGDVSPSATAGVPASLGTVTITHRIATPVGATPPPEQTPTVPIGTRTGSSGSGCALSDAAPMDGRAGASLGGVGVAIAAASARRRRTRRIRASGAG